MKFFQVVFGNTMSQISLHRFFYSSIDKAVHAFAGALGVFLYLRFFSLLYSYLYLLIGFCIILRYSFALCIAFNWHGISPFIIVHLIILLHYTVSNRQNTQNLLLTFVRYSTLQLSTDSSIMKSQRTKRKNKGDNIMKYFNDCNTLDELKNIFKIFKIKG